MTNTAEPRVAAEKAGEQTDYRLEDQIGFILRQVSQRHSQIFAELMTDGLTPTQFAALSKLSDAGECSQNQLGRLTAMDAATIKGVVDRLVKRGFVETRSDPTDRRRRVVALTPAGSEGIARAHAMARKITTQTQAPLTAAERRQLLNLLRKLR